MEINPKILYLIFAVYLHLLYICSNHLYRDKVNFDPQNNIMWSVQRILGVVHQTGCLVRRVGTNCLWLIILCFHFSNKSVNLFGFKLVGLKNEQVKNPGGNHL